MGKIAAPLLVLVFLTTSCLIVAKPVLSSVNVAENSWTTKARMSLTRTGFGVAVVNGKIYAIGGASVSAGYVPIDVNLEYDPATDKWTSKEHMPGPLAWFGTAVYQNEIYVIGGALLFRGTEVSDVRVYNPATDTWISRTSMPTARGGVQANVVNGKIYVIGGVTGGEVTGVNEVYDPVTGAWVKKAPIPTPVSAYASAVVDGKIYVIGGLTRVANSTALSRVNLNQIYDPETNSWSLGTPMPNIQNSISAGATTGIMAPKRIYVIGDGLNQVYNPANDSWTAGAPIPNTASRLTNFDDVVVAVMNDQLYAMGGVYAGEDGSPYSVNEQYMPIGYGTVQPLISVVSPENKTYTTSNVSLTFTVNKPTVWLGYSLDGQEIVTVTGNTTLSGLSSGLHNVTVYAQDEFENTEVSETIYFTVAEPFPVVPVAAVTVAVVAVMVAGLLVYSKKRKRYS